ncbi:SCO2322 family protein [Streptomyces sp. ME01-24h]|nr:SCO2322 family protein [Streptomyces sp. ME19-03-3]MDX3353866.1 SCO2322 family protein [Streptomyces sp. ME01-24h]
MRRPPLTAAALLLALVAALVATPAHAASYRYWSFWQRDTATDAWTFATTGPALNRPDDGAVEGWRFGVSPDAASAARPRGAARFAAVCDGTPARPGTKRVALLLDFGTAADAPAARAACARVPEDATSADALAAIAPPLRYNSAGIVCALAGYPAKGCGEQVTDAAAAPEPTSSPGPALGTYAAAAVVLLVAAAGGWQVRRRRGDRP